ncbi:MAG: PH domain-containing protein [Bacillota bacterium]|nr:PH domain-containing protein [Bacillota bacterium]
MIDFQNSALFKLTVVDNKTGSDLCSPILVDGEKIIASFKAIRDMVIFTDKRIISVNVQGLTGTKKDFTTLPYSKVQAFSVETAGTFDLDCELDLFFTGLGKVRFEFKGSFDIKTLSRLIGSYVL